MKKIILLLLSFCIQLHASLPESANFLIFGANGWIGQKIVKAVQERGHNAIIAQSRLENRQDIIKEIEKTQPHYIINAAGVIGSPNVDWCETHKAETLRTNVIGTLNLADICYMHNINMTNITTGCIYEYDESHPLASGIGFTEEDAPNFDASFYSKTKIKLEELLLEYPNVLSLRVKMPISTELNKGFIGKIIQYKKIINVPNSITVLDDLVPLLVDMTLKNVTGNYNLVNPGTLSHSEILDLYKKYIDPSHTYESFSFEEQNKVLSTRRSNAELSASKLLALYPQIPHIKDSIINIFECMKKS